MKTGIVITGCFLLLFYSCKQHETDDLTSKKETFTGYVQKGPFINGSSITISELDVQLNQTGRTYLTSIADNSGRFEQKNIELASNYVALTANGFYFNEITGDKSSAPLTLNAVADVSDQSSVNVNILTHLEKSRIEYLVAQKALTFKKAKAQAQKEILNIFSYEKADIADFELLSLTEDGDDNAILFSISIILQGYRTTADMSELLADIITDIREDGTLTGSATGSRIVEDAELLDLPKIRVNMEDRYKDLGMTVSIPSFEKYVKQFVDNTEFKSTKFIVYPGTSDYGANILNDELTTVYLPKDKDPAIKYSMAADLPSGTNLKIVLKGGSWAYQAMPDGPVNWTVSEFDNGQQTFTATESGKRSDLNIQFSTPGIISIEYYENNATDPTKIKELKTE